MINTNKKYSNTITAAKKISSNIILSLLSIEILCNIGANYFIVNDLEYLHDLVWSIDIVGLIGGSTANVDYKGTLYLYLKSNSFTMLI